MGLHSRTQNHTTAALMRQQRNQNNDRNRHSQQQQQNRSHILLLLSRVREPPHGLSAFRQSSLQSSRRTHQSATPETSIAEHAPPLYAWPPPRVVRRRTRPSRACPH